VGGNSHTKICPKGFRASLGKIGQKSSSPPKIYLLLYLWVETLCITNRAFTKLSTVRPRFLPYCAYPTQDSIALYWAKQHYYVRNRNKPMIITELQLNLQKPVYEKKPFSAKNQTLRSYRVYISPTK